jgi:hypothetical protein
MPFDGRKLILEAAGGFRPGERVQQLLQRVVDETGLGFRSVEAFWKGQYGSKKTISKLEQKARNNEDKVAAKLGLASELEALANEDELAGRSQAVVELLRSAAHTLRDKDL